MASKDKAENSFWVEAPDRGWSWVVAVACCLINMLFIGTVRMGSLLYVAIIRSLNVSRKEAALPFSLASSLKCFCGPLFGFLADRFGIRLITLTGGIFGAFGIGMCFFTHRIIPITIFWSLFFGMGYGMGTALLPAILNQYFDKYRARAIGISFSGGCLGSFLLPLLVEFCLREYELNGTFLIVSGVVLNCIPLALLLRKPSYFSKSVPPKCTPSHFTDEYANDNKHSLKNRDTSYGKVNVGALRTVLWGNVKENDSLSPTTNIKAPFPETTQLPSLEGPGCSGEKSENCSLYKATVKRNETLEEKNIFTIDGNVQYHTIVNEKPQNIEFHDIIKIHAFASENPSAHNSFRKNMNLFRNPMFILIGMNRAFYSCTLSSTMTVLADFAVDIGVGIPKTPYILMSLSVGAFLGRISLGSLIDKGFMTVMQYTATFFLLQALFLALLARATGFWYLIAIGFAYGVCEAALMLSSPLLVADCIETELQTTAMPSIQIFSGFTFLTIPKLIELFREQMGSYVGLFYTMSAVSLICSVTWFIVPCYRKRRL